MATVILAGLLLCASGLVLATLLALDVWGRLPDAADVDYYASQAVRCLRRAWCRYRQHWRHGLDVDGSTYVCRLCGTRHASLTAAGAIEDTHVSPAELAHIQARTRLRAPIQFEPTRIVIKLKEVQQRQHTLTGASQPTAGRGADSKRGIPADVPSGPFDGQHAGLRTGHSS